MADLPPGTYTVSQLGAELKEILDHTLSAVWVAGEVRGPTVSRAGHLYFELVEKDAGDTVRGVVQAVIFRRDHQRVRRVLHRAGLEMQEGQQIRCFGGLDFYAAGGRLQFIGRDVDPLFSLGDLAQRRAETVARLEGEGLAGRNRALELAVPTLRIALLTSLGSAAEQDFSATIAASAFSLRREVFDVAVQGPTAEAEVVGALRTIERRAADFDVVVLVRGGGSKSDLVAFDSWGVASSIARCPIPVLTGLGHEIDESIADRVAHTSFKTPTAVAEELVRRVVSLDAGLDALTVRLVQATSRRLHEQDHRLTRLELRKRRAQLGLVHATRRLDRLADALLRAAARAVKHAKDRLDQEGLRTVTAAGSRIEARRNAASSLAERATRVAHQALDQKRERIEARHRWVEQLSPERTLRRGFSITRGAQGRAVRGADELEAGESLVTDLHRGSIESTVTAVHPRSSKGEEPRADRAETG